MRYRAAFIVLALAAPLAQSADTPYAGQESRRIKALSEQDIADFREGRGMRMSLAAELNHYPGPRHVLEHAQAIGLSAEQQAQARKLVDAMAREASRLGEQIVLKEGALDALFADGRASAESVRQVVREIGALQADYRLVHLETHLAMRQLLTPQQVAVYDNLRGYTGANSGHGGHGHQMMHGKTGHE